jgi:23S rRNA (adenine2503-C2)-methyltransferase
MQNIVGFPEEEIKEFIVELGEKPFRASQILTWIYHHKARGFDVMTNLSKDLRARLSENFLYSLPPIKKKSTSSDGTIKYLFEFEDGSDIESVWMPSEGRNTLCISTQVGCRMACTFCLTGQLGLKRNLSSAEIVGQIMAVDRDLEESEKNPISNVVIMGMGEPLDNYEELVKAIRLMVSPHAMKISNRKVTLSTSGLVDKIKRFAEEDLHVNMAISLNATENSTRSDIMPINKKHTIEELMETLRTYPLKATRRLTFEYVLLRGVNDSHEDAVRLGKMLHGFKCKINLIPFNSFDRSDFQTPHENRVSQFQEYLLARNFTVFVRKNRGTDILGACGQLAAESFSAA